MFDEHHDRTGAQFYDRNGYDRNQYAHNIDFNHYRFVLNADCAHDEDRRAHDSGRHHNIHKRRITLATFHIP